MALGLNKIIRMFKYGSVMVTGMRGRGKDLLFGNVIARRKEGYVSNIDYGYNRIPLEYTALNVGSSYKDIIEDRVKPYSYPYYEGEDIYISDGGIVFPSQYCNELNRDYKDLPIFMALSRQLADVNVHVNTQNYGRLWDKMREQCDQYIYCNSCKYIFGYVIQRVTIYDKAESCQNRVKPCRIRVPLFANATAKMNARTYLDNFENQHGNVKSYLLIYKNKSKHDTRYFKTLFEEASSET